jgi:hypothetical protein
LAEARKIDAALRVGARGRNASSNDRVAAEKKKQAGIVGPVLGATKGITNHAQGLSARTGAALKDPLSDPFILVIVGLSTLASAFLGALVLYRLSREHLRH